MRDKIDTYIEKAIKLLYSEKLRLIFLCICTMLIGRIELAGKINPVIMAFAACFCFKREAIPIFISACVGVLSISERLDGAAYIISLVIMGVFHILGRNRLSGQRICIFTGALSVLSGCMIYYSIAAPGLYMVVLAIIQAALTALLSFMFMNGIELLMGNEREYIATEEALGTLLIGLAVVCGCGDIRIMNVSLMAFTTSLLIFLCCERGGIALGIGFGAIESAVLYFAGLYPIEIIPTITLGAVLAFIGGKAHRLLIPLGYMLGAVPIAIYFNLDIGDMGSIIGMLLAGAVNRFLPDKLYIAYSSVINTGYVAAEKYTRELQGITSARLGNLANTFENIAKTYSLSVNEENSDTKGLCRILCRGIEQDICSSCPMLSCCCKGNEIKRRNYIESFVQRWLDNLSTSESYIPEAFRQCCGRYRAMAESARYYVELLIVEQGWRERLERTRNLVSDQMSTISRVIAQVGRELMLEMNIDRELSSDIYKALYEYGVKSVVACRSSKALTIYIALPKCTGTKLCSSRLIPIVNSMLPVNMKNACGQCSTCNGMCHLELVQEPPMRVNAFCMGMAREGSEISGDSYSYMDIGGGKYLLALADGMGSGYGARGESSASIELYEDFMSAGFDRTTAIDIINSILLMGENNECYSTLDICNIDLFSGNAEFVKIGAVNTFLIHSGEIEQIGSTTLPVGILHKVDSYVCERQLERGDKLIMLTDGILASGGRAMNEEWLLNLIMKNKTKAPKKLAKKIIESAAENCRGSSEDDMSVLVASIF